MDNELIFFPHQESQKIKNIIPRKKFHSSACLIWVFPDEVIIGNEAIKIAAAGVGSPIKEVVCLLSILNLESRIDEKIGIKKAI